VLDVTRPDTHVVVIVDGHVRVVDHDAVNEDARRGALALTGDAVEVLEALSVRVPWRQAIPDDRAWLLAGLTEVFESPAPG
jgi:hypothetical protein